MVKNCVIIKPEKEIDNMRKDYEYTENKKLVCYNPRIGKRPLYPYTYDEKAKCWVNRSGQLSRQRVNQLENENRLMWY